MKNLIIPILFTLSLLTFSCGKKQEEKKLEPETVDMTVKFKYAHEDTFKVYYTKDSKAPIDGSLMMTLPVHASKDFQEVTFVFPLGDFPKVIRLDVGNNQEATNIEIKDIKIMQGDNVIDDSDWITTKNWSPNESLLSEENPNSYKIIPINGTKGPVFMSNITIQEKLEKLLKN